MVVRFQQHGWRSVVAATGAVLLAPLFSGCAGTVDRITSQQFRDKPFHTMFYSDDPLEILRSGPEGSQRAWALIKIKEPKRAGHSNEEQNEVVQILLTSATSDKHSICRINAIEALSHYEDPRAAGILVTAYRSAGKEAPSTEVASSPEEGIVLAGGRRSRSPFAPVSSVTPDQVLQIQCKALEAIGRNRSPEGLVLLCEVAAKPAKQEAKSAELDAMNPGNLGQDQFDIRLAAITALGNYKGEPQAARALYQVMLTDREVAPRSTAYQGLMKVTGKNLPPASPEWASIVPGSEVPVMGPSKR